MHDGREVIAKLPNPNAGRLHFTTASEVATMDFLRNTLHLPVPKFHAWSSRASDNAKAQIVKQIVDIEKTIASTKFTKLGALYYKRDLPSSDHDTVLYVDRAGNKVHTEEFGIGPTNHRSFFDFGRGELDIDRGPWSTTTAYLEAVAHREISCVDMGLRYPLMPEGPFYGPGQYQPSASKKLSALRNYLKVAPYVLPDNRAIHVPVLWHGDLHLQNIFVDPAEPTRIVGIIDWQSVSICPLFTQVTMPGFLDYNGPIPKELGRVSLPPNFGSTTPDEQREAKELHQAQTLHNLYLALSRQINPTAFQAIKGQDSLRHQGGRERVVNDGRVSNEDYEVSKRQLAEGIESFLSREARSREERKAWLQALPFVD
ncbi:hypothetical protein D8B26_001612 [Coccidioides posadasii str. Silveira]|uniref:Phosphotransferase n=1 Tax=Coccidioides posadasii (strain RMSCC 757 / Silveira) TaxID=443226 RepID=E9CVT1_COCPS|nr:phosphotransferase [Coccidioides posadasii str. Silveira]QVM06909.1 hypothetical protein D8B26_001612 [Coccidioides posadasii str. Silveira]